MNEEAMNQAFNAIHNKAAELLKYDSPKEVTEGLNVIIALARYQHDVRTYEEKGRAESQGSQ